jgi:CHAT domain-containing protein
VLTVAQLLDMRLRRDTDDGRLAVLTACDSAVAGSTVPDEVVSLSAALLQAGLTGVVATQWPIRGLPSALLTVRFYWHSRHSGHDWATSLTLAQRWLRDSTNRELAQFVHPKGGLAIIPVPTRRSLWRALVARNPAARSFADVGDWGAYVYVGDPGPRPA